MIPERYAAITYSLFRIVFGFVFLCYGLQKLLGWFGGPAAPLVDMRGYAGLIETVTGLLIMLGLFTKYAAFLASGEMAAAYFMAHLPRGFWPIQNGGELAALYAFLFLYVAARGSGRWSLASASDRPDLA